MRLILRKGIKGARDWDHDMSEARRELDWERQFELAMDGEKARRYRAESTPSVKIPVRCAEKCVRCAISIKFCAVKTSISWINIIIKM